MKKITSYTAYLHDFLKYNIAVECPKCEQKAIVECGHFSFHSPEQSFRLVCTSCGFNKTKQPDSFVFGVSYDPFFQLPLWYQCSFNEQTLWAYNTKHLQFLENHISAKMRERSAPYANRSLGSRLPKWMTSAKNRQGIVKLIKQLSQK